MKKYIAIILLLSSTFHSKANDFVQEGENWKFISSKGRIEIPADTVKHPVYVKILELKQIEVAGFNSARIYVSLTEKDYANKETNGQFIAGKTKIEIGCFHNLDTGSDRYLNKVITAETTTSFGGYVIAPVIGTSLRVLVWGHDLPRKDMTLEYSIYLIK